MVTKNSVGEAPNESPSSSRRDGHVTGVNIGRDGRVGNLKVLQDLKFGHVEKLVLSPVELSKLIREAKNVEFELEDAIESFTGRAEILKDLHKKIQDGKEKREDITILSQTRIISGMGGVGKTQTIRKYIQMHKAQFYDHIIWINAENESTMRSSLRTLAQTELRITCTNDQGDLCSDDDIKKIVYDILCERRCLIVFDNAESWDETNGIKTFLPTTIKGSWKSPTVIVTSRWRKWEENVLKDRVIQLKGLSQAEIWEFFSTYLNLDNTDENRELSAKIGDLCEGLPIVLQQVWALIRTENDDREVTGEDPYTMRDFLSSYEERKKTYLNLKPKDSSCSDSVYTIFCLTFSKLVKKETGPLALHYLRLMSVLSPSRIPRPLFLSLLDDSQKAGYIAPIKLLNNYNLISIPKSHLEVHRIVQEVTKLHMNAAESVEDPLYTDKRTPLDKLLTHIMARLNVYLPEIEPNDVNKHACFQNAFCVASHSIHMLTEDSFPFFASLINLAGTTYTRETYAMVCSVLSECKKLRAASGDPDAWLSQNLKAFMYLQAVQASLLNGISKYSESQELCKEVLSVMENKHEWRDRLLEVKASMATNHEWRDRLLEVKAVMASNLVELGNFIEAQQQIEYLINEKLKNGDEVRVHSLRINLVDILMKRCHYDEAFAILKPMVDKLETASSAWEADNLSLQGTFATVLMLRGKYDEALKRLKNVVSYTGQIYGEFHPSTFRRTNELVACLLQMDKVDEARELIQKIEKHLVELVGEDQREVLNLKRLLAHTFEKTGRYEEALKVLETVAMKWKKHGDNHPSYLNLLRDIASIEGTLGRYDNALPRLDYIINLSNANFDSDHLLILEAMNSKACLLVQMGKVSDAEVMFRELMKMYEKKCGKSHCGAIGAKKNLVATLYELGNLPKALALQMEIITFYEDTRNSEDVDMLEGKLNLATILNSSGKFQKALDIYEVTIPKLFKALGNSKTHKKILRGKKGMAGALYNARKITESISLYKEIIQDCSEVSKVDPMFVIEVRGTLANILTRMGQYQELIRLLEETLPLLERTLGALHPKSVEAKISLAEAMHFVNPNSSFKLDAEIVAACHTCYGKHDPQTKKALRKLTSIIRSVKSICSIDSCLAILEEKLDDDEKGLNTDYWMLKMKISTGFILAILGGKDMSCEISKSFSNSLRMFDRQMSQGSPTILKICKYAQLLRARIQFDEIGN